MKAQAKMKKPASPSKAFAGVRAIRPSDIEKPPVKTVAGKAGGGAYVTRKKKT